MDSLRNHLALYGVVAMLIWMATDFFGGMFLYLVVYFILILPFLLLYISSLLETIVSTILTGFKSTKIRVYIHGFFLFIVLCFTLYHSELFKSTKVLSATLKDDLFSYHFIFRENGTVENHISGFLGFEEMIKGTYKIKGDTIIFTQVPYKSDFIPEKLLIDREANAVWIHRDKNGAFDREKVDLNYLEIWE